MGAVLPRLKRVWHRWLAARVSAQKDGLLFVTALSDLVCRMVISTLFGEAGGIQGNSGHDVVC